MEDNKTILCVYDKGGNIVSKTEYEYTLDEITEAIPPVKTSGYTYGDFEWKYLLTAFTYTVSEYTSDNISSQLLYDSVGNVTSYNGTTFTWTAGRQLESALTPDGEFVKYYYNSDGYLSQIDLYTADENTGEYTNYSGGIKYIWNGDTLVSRSIYGIEENKAITSRIIYDTEGEAQGIELSASSDTECNSLGIFFVPKKSSGRHNRTYKYRRKASL